MNLGQVQFAARLLALIIEQCHGLSVCLAFPSPTSPVHAAPILPRIDHALGEHGYKSPSLEVWVSLDVTGGGGLSIAARSLTGRRRKERLPIGAEWGSFGRDAAGELERIPHLVIGPGAAAVSTAHSFRNQDTQGNPYMVITNSCHYCEIEHLASL